MFGNVDNHSIHSILVLSLDLACNCLNCKVDYKNLESSLSILDDLYHYHRCFGLYQQSFGKWDWEWNWFVNREVWSWAGVWGCKLYVDELDVNVPKCDWRLPNSILQVLVLVSLKPTKGYSPLTSTNDDLFAVDLVVMHYLLPSHSLVELPNCFHLRGIWGRVRYFHQHKVYYQM